MSLIESCMTECVRMIRETAPDGVGGYTETYTQGEPFEAALFVSSETPTRPAEKSVIDPALYSVTVRTGTSIAFHEVFKRVSDGVTFRAVESTDDRLPPVSASTQYVTFSAERWVIPDESDGNGA